MCRHVIDQSWLQVLWEKVTISSDALKMIEECMESSILEVPSLIVKNITIAIENDPKNFYYFVEALRTDCNKEDIAKKLEKELEQEKKKHRSLPNLRSPTTEPPSLRKESKSLVLSSPLQVSSSDCTSDIVGTRMSGFQQEESTLSSALWRKPETAYNKLPETSTVVHASVPKSSTQSFGASNISSEGASPDPLSTIQRELSDDSSVPSPDKFSCSPLQVSKAGDKPPNDQEMCIFVGPLELQKQPKNENCLGIRPKHSPSPLQTPLLPFNKP